MTISDFNNIISSSRLILIDFYATWCGACRAVDPALDRVAIAMGDSVTLIRIDIDSIASYEIARRYNIVSVPTLILFQYGKPIWRESGVISYERLQLALRRYQSIESY